MLWFTNCILGERIGLMKFYLKAFLVFAVLTVVLSAYTGCTGSGSGVSTGDTTGRSNSTVSSGATDDDSTYPAIPASLAESKFELMDGTMATLNDRKGKVVLVNLWGIWCGPCRAEMPHLVELQKKYETKGFQVLGLNIGDADRNPEDIAKIVDFGKKMGLNYELARGPSDMTIQINRLARFDGVPLSLLISRNGKLRAVLRGAGDDAIELMKKSVDTAMAQ